MVFTRHLLKLMEVCVGTVVNREPCLLVGETGIGKTAAISELARLCGPELVSINLSQQSDSSDLLGG